MTTTDASTRPPLTAAEVRALFTTRALRGAWLEIEAVLAETQAELGMIPAEAAPAIRAVASFAVIDPDALERDIARTRAPVVSLVRAMAQAAGDPAGGYVHWGATTQNVVQTARTMAMKQAHAAFLARFDRVLGQLADMAEQEARTLTVARTNRRHALPVTWGFKVAAWIEEWLRHRARLTGAAPRVFCAQWGGAVGAMHASGPQGPALNARLAARLGLGHMRVPSRAAQDSSAEYVLLLALFGTTCAKIAQELFTLMGDEIDEVVEDSGDEVVGSSTMPHKVNSKVAVEVLALAARLRAQATLAFDAMQPSHEGDGASSLMLAPMMAEVCPLSVQLVETMEELFAVLRLNRDRMRRNLAQTGESVASENLMMVLGPLIGRTRAHDILHHAIADPFDARPLSERLLAPGMLPDGVEPEVIRAALDPAAYLGRSVEMALEMAQMARAEISDQRAGRGCQVAASA